MLDFRLTPRASFADRPNFPQLLRSATLGLTTSLCVVNRILRVVLTFLPSSLYLHVMIVLVPSLFVVVEVGGSSVTVSSRSSSSAQSLRLREAIRIVSEALWWNLCSYLSTFDILVGQ
jgi:hypothetical protein